MLMLVAEILGALGLVCILSRRTLLGILVGVQLFLTGAALMFVMAGAMTDQIVTGHLFAIFITLSAVAALVAGYALAIRFSLLKSGLVKMDSLNHLKH